MSRREREPVFIAQFGARHEAERVWALLADHDIPGAVITEHPPWGQPVHRVQVARADAARTLQVLSDGGY